MSMKPLAHDRSYGELDQVVRAHLGHPPHRAGRAPKPPWPPRPRGPGSATGAGGEALEAYLRHTWHTRPWAIAVAERQLREYAAAPPPQPGGDEGYALPDVGLPAAAVREWLLGLADRLRASVEEGAVPPPGPPRTHWEWQARFPELAQFLGGWFSHRMPDEFADHDAAVADYVAAAHPGLVARLAGEAQELLALDLPEPEYAAGLAELGMEVAPPVPYAPSGWLSLLVDLVGVPSPEHPGEPAAER